MANGQTNISGGKALVGTAKPSDVRMGMTYPDGKELRSGTLDLRNLKPENVRMGVNIAGIVGTHTDITKEIGVVEYKNGSWVSITSGYQATVIRKAGDTKYAPNKLLWEMTVTGLKTKPRGILVMGVFNTNGQSRYLAAALANFCYIESFLYDHGAGMYNGGFEIGVWTDNGYSPPYHFFNKIIWETYS